MNKHLVIAVIAFLVASATVYAAAPLRAGQPYAEAKCTDPNVILCEDFNYPQNFYYSGTVDRANANWVNPGLATGLFGFIYGVGGRRINPASSYPAKPQGALPSGTQADHVWVANWDPSKGEQGNGGTWGQLRNPGTNYPNGMSPATDVYIRFQYYVTPNYAWPGDPKTHTYYFGSGSQAYDNKILFIYPPEGPENPTNAAYDAGLFTEPMWDPSTNARFTDALGVRIGDSGDNYKIFPMCSWCNSNPQHMEYGPFQSLTLRDPDDRPILGKVFRFNTNRWYTIEMRYKMGSAPGAKDGTVEVWIDGTKVYSANDLATCGYGNGDCSGLGAIYLGAYHNMNDYTTWNGQQVIDNLIISKSYIGPPGNGSTTPDPTPDTTPPTVAVTSPANGATLSGTTSITATATDASGIGGVQFKINGVNLGTEDTTSPYGVSWDTATVTNGQYTVSAMARDAAGNAASAGIQVTVSNVQMSGDVNGDRMVNVHDLSIVSANYGRSGFAARADVAPPYGIIDLADLMVVAGNWGVTY